jgi:Tol biopolymer transport system component
MRLSWGGRLATLAVLALLASGCSFMARASVARTGGDTNGISEGSSISADGRYVAFESYASDLVAGDGTSGFDGNDIFRRDLLTGTTTRVSVSAGGGDPDGPSFAFFANAISADGQRIAFTSSASNLVADDHNTSSDVFVRDLGTNTTTRISAGLAGGDAAGESTQAEISSSGRYVAFGSDATNLVPGGGNCTTTEVGLQCWSDVYVRDTETGTTTKVSPNRDGGNADASSQDGSVSADGRYVTFSSLADDLVPDDGNHAIDVFVRDLHTGRTTRLSVDRRGGDATGGQSYWPSITPDARFVVFTSKADNLVGHDQNGVEDVYVRRLR